MDLVDLFIEPDLSCNKSSYSLREDLLSQIINSMYKFFNPFISNGTLIRDTLPSHLGVYAYNTFLKKLLFTSQ